MEDLAETLFVSKVPLLSKIDIGSQLSFPFVKLNAVIGVPSFKTGLVRYVAQVARLEELLTPDCSVVPYSYIPDDVPPRELFQPKGVIRDKPLFEGLLDVSIVVL